MTIIKTITGLRNHSNDSFTKKQQIQIDLYQKLSVAEAESRSLAPRISHEDLMKSLSETINETKIKY